MTDSQKLDLLLHHVSAIEEKMVTKNELNSELGQVDKKLEQMESSLLREIDHVQEKANEHFASLEKEFVNVKNAVNTIKFETGTLNLLVNRVSVIEEDVKVLKERVTSIS